MTFWTWTGENWDSRMLIVFNFIDRHNYAAFVAVLSNQMQMPVELLFPRLDMTVKIVEIAAVSLENKQIF